VPTKPTRGVRCHAIARSTGQQCQRWAVDGADVCRKHGAQLPVVRARAASNRAARIVEQALAGYGSPLPEGPDATPEAQILAEIRRTGGHVKFLEEKVATLAQDDIVWGRVMKEVKEATGWGENNDSYVKTVDQARHNIWVELYQRERKHLVDVCKVAIAAGFEERRVQAEEQAATAVNAVIAKIIYGLGQDPLDPEVRNVVRMALLDLDATVLSTELL
jgi:hypothetical protein